MKISSSHFALYSHTIKFLVCVAILGALSVLSGCGDHEQPGTVTESTVPEPEIKQRQARQSINPSRSSVPTESSQILFGDFHVHTTFSHDAMMISIPIMGGDGSRPPADACDFARFCSQLDFWSINDHGEAMTPRHWDELKNSIRQCNAVGQGSGQPDLVSFIGWEWSQKSAVPENHYGHRNVIFKNLADTRVPARAISSKSPHEKFPDPSAAAEMAAELGSNLVLSPESRDRLHDFGTFLDEIHDVELCPKNVNSRKLPEDCLEVAKTPETLFRKLDEWDLEDIVIPHATSQGGYTPAGPTWRKQLNPDDYDTSSQKLVEIYSGHGNFEEYRDYRPVKYDENGEKYCPEPTENYLPCCWQAGRIIEERCDDPDSKACQKQVRKARKAYVEQGTVDGHLTVPATKPEDWKNCGMCEDCFLPAFKHRPQSSVQYILAMRNFEFDKANPMQFQFGFIGSSDNHAARPGTGYKEFGRTKGMVESNGFQSKFVNETLRPRLVPGENRRDTRPIDPSDLDIKSYFQRVGYERQVAANLTGGLVAVHAAEKNRDSIWSSLKKRQVYGTSGDRILLWFSLRNGQDGTAPMGAETRANGDPHFRVRAFGAFEQKPGCPEFVKNRLGPDRTQSLCAGECYNPGNERHDLDRIEVVRIQPQTSDEEEIGSLIDDPWRSFDCPDNTTGCEVEFTDSAFEENDRQTLYYVRAIQEPTPAVNAGGFRCEYNDEGECIDVNLCYGDYRTDPEDNCLAPARERAWSSPIWVNPP